MFLVLEGVKAYHNHDCCKEGLYFVFFSLHDNISRREQRRFSGEDELNFVHSQSDDSRLVVRLSGQGGNPPLVDPGIQQARSAAAAGSGCPGFKVRS